MKWTNWDQAAQAPENQSLLVRHLFTLHRNSPRSSYCTGQADHVLIRRGGLCVHAIEALSARVDVFFIYMYINHGGRVERVDLTLAQCIAA